MINFFIGIYIIINLYAIFKLISRSNINREEINSLFKQNESLTEALQISLIARNEIRERLDMHERCFKKVTESICVDKQVLNKTIQSVAAIKDNLSEVRVEKVRLQNSINKQSDQLYRMSCSLQEKMRV